MLAKHFSPGAFMTCSRPRRKAQLHKRKDGTEFPVSLSRSVIRDKDKDAIADVHNCMREDSKLFLCLPVFNGTLNRYR